MQASGRNIPRRRNAGYRVSFISWAVDETVVPVFLSRDEIQRRVRHTPVILRRQEPLGSKQIVVRNFASGNAPHTSMKNFSISESFNAPQLGKEI